MVAGSQIEGGSGTQNLSAGVRWTIQSIKEIVGNHSDADIYVALKETNMDPNETAQKLLNQDPFHEVKRKRDKKKEGTAIKGSVPIEPRKPSEHVVQGVKSNTYSDRNPRKGGYGRNNATGITREFRVVRDNRANQNVHREIKPLVHSSVTVSAKEPPVLNVSEKSSARTSKNLKSPTGHNLPQSPNVPNGSHSKQTKGVSSSGSEPNDKSGGRRPVVSNVAPSVQVTKAHDSQRSSVVSPNSSALGVYSSSSDPVHIPSLASRPAANVGAIKHEVWAVGVRRHSSGVNGPGFIGTPTKSASSPSNNSKDLPTEAAQSQDILPHESIHEDQNVIIAAHIRVSETDRCWLTFGSLGTEVESSQNSGYQEVRHVEESHVEPLASIPAPESSSDEPSGSK